MAATAGRGVECQYPLKPVSEPEQLEAYRDSFHRVDGSHEHPLPEYRYDRRRSRLGSGSESLAGGEFIVANCVRCIYRPSHRCGVVVLR